MILNSWIEEQLKSDDPLVLRNVIAELRNEIKMLDARLPHYAMEQFVKKAWPKLFRFMKSRNDGRWSYTGSFKRTTLRIFELAGRVIVTFENKGTTEQVTYITSDDDEIGEHFGLQSYEGTLWVHDAAISEVTQIFEDAAESDLEKWLRHNVRQSIG